ncbi:MAG: GAF domain-containing protein [Burkholderiales bacterium]|nr:GAF domain-containing protein [Anaerolineae bacterium]
MVTNPMTVMQRENVRLQEENQKLQQEVRSHREFIAVLTDLTGASSRMHTDAELMPLLRDIFSKALRLLNAPDGSLSLLDAENNELQFVLVAGALAEELVGYRLPANEGIAGWVVQHGEATLVHDARRDPRFSGSIDQRFRFQTQSIAAAPLIGDGRVLGVIEALNRPGGQPFSELDLALLRLMCHYAGEALANIERSESNQ